MNNPYTRQHSGVILVPVTNSIQTDENLEPQFIRRRANDNSYIFIDSEDATDVRHGGSGFKVGGSNNLFATKIKKFAINYIGINWIVPNVNIKNNIIGFVSSNTGATIHSVTIPEGFYSTSVALMTALQTALNTATGASGLTFTITVDPLNSTKATISSAGGSFYFDKESLGVKYGTSLWSLPTDIILSTSKTCGPILLHYTRFIDIISNNLNQYTKNPSYSSSGLRNGRLVFRFNIIDPTVPDYFDFEIKNMRWINYLRTRSLNDIDFEFYDEYGRHLYIPQFTNVVKSLPFSMALLTEL